MSAMNSTIVLASALVGVSLTAAGCATRLEAPIPGPAEGAFEPIPEALIHAALKCQITRGILKVDKLKAESSHPEAASFKFKSATGTFSGSVQTAVVNGTTISAIFPFSGYDGTVATPNFGSSTSGTAVQEVKRSFEIGVDVKKEDDELCTYLEEEKKIDVGDFVTNSIVGAFETFDELPRRRDTSEAYGPALKVSITETTASFTVVRKLDGGLTLTVVPSGPRMDEGKPGVTASRERKDVYTLTTKFSSKVGEETVSRRLHFCVRDNRGQSLCVEEPFTDARYEQLKDELGTRLINVVPNGILPFEGNGDDPEVGMQFPAPQDSVEY